LVIEHALRRAKRRLKPKRPQLADQDSKDAQTRPAVEG
jgi:hypothetical protein